MSPVSSVARTEEAAGLSLGVVGIDLLGTALDVGGLREMDGVTECEDRNVKYPLEAS